MCRVGVVAAVVVVLLRSSCEAAGVEAGVSKTESWGSRLSFVVVRLSWSMGTMEAPKVVVLVVDAIVLA